MILENYEEFCDWIKSSKRDDNISRATPSFVEGKIYLKCPNCEHPFRVYKNCVGWNTGDMNKHLRAPNNCGSTTTSELTSIESRDSLTVCLTLDIIPKIKYSKTHLDLLILLSDFCCCIFSTWMVIATWIPRKLKIVQLIHRYKAMSKFDSFFLF